MRERIEITVGDITQQKVDAIVNAANTSLLGGGGVDGAIHRAAGPELLEECRSLNGCPTGEAKITPGFKLPSQWVIHTVGPVWKGGDSREPELLANCYKNSLQLAREHQVRTIAFPSISTGAYHFPLDRAARIAIEEIARFLKAETYPKKVIFVCFDDSVYQAYEQAVHDVVGETE